MGQRRSRASWSPERSFWGGIRGFDPDDLFYLIGPLAWVGAFPFVLLSGSIVLVPTAAVIGIWLWRARLRSRTRHSNTQTRNV